MPEKQETPTISTTQWLLNFGVILVLCVVIFWIVTIGAREESMRQTAMKQAEQMSFDVKRSVAEVEDQISGFFDVFYFTRKVDNQRAELFLTELVKSERVLTYIRKYSKEEYCVVGKGSSAVLTGWWVVPLERKFSSTGSDVVFETGFCFRIDEEKGKPNVAGYVFQMNPARLRVVPKEDYLRMYFWPMEEVKRAIIKEIAEKRRNDKTSVQ